jgi:hypothetical protein
MSEHGGDGAWIGVDLDGTLAYYDGWDGGRIGAPVPAMVERVKGWLAEGKSVRIVTARVSNDASPPERVEQRVWIQRWCQEHIGRVLTVTCEKDFGMVELWDDRCVQVVKNTGLTKEEAAGGVGAAGTAVALLTGTILAEPGRCAHVLVVSVNREEAFCCVCRAPLPGNACGITVKSPL